MIAIGTGPFTYPWIQNGVSITGATQATYGCTNAQFSNAGSYVVQVSNSYGAVLSQPASVIVLPTQPYKIPHDPTQPVIIQLVAIPDGTKGLMFHGAVGSSYEVHASSDQKNWTVLTNVTAAYNVNQFIDLDATNYPSRFYRIQLK